MINAAFVIPGDISLPTGGYGYDRRVLALLRKMGAVRHVALAGGYPTPTADDLTATAQTLASLPERMVLLIIAGFLLVYPASAADVIGFVLVLVVLAMQWFLKPSTQTS